MAEGYPAEVYPRVCGGTPVHSRSLGKKYGLSPRVRGNLGTLLGLYNRRRSIPACAGEPWSVFVRHSQIQVYPRVCGGTPSAFYRLSISYSLDLDLILLAYRRCISQPSSGLVVFHQINAVRVYNLLGRLAKGPDLLVTYS